MDGGRPLSHIELFSISHKDEQYFRYWIGDPTQALAQKLFGARRWISLRNAITVLSRFGYLAATTLSNVITPGEEYCDALQTRRNFLQRLAMILLNNELKIPSEIPRPYANLLKDVHIITFFLFGDFYEISKRVTNYTYSTDDHNLYQSNKISLLYRILGCMSLIKLLLTISRQTELYTENDNTKVADIIPDVDQKLLCQLCNEIRTEPTSTLCGHIFCWTCIHKWLKQRSECPICRAPTEPSRLIHLLNFR